MVPQDNNNSNKVNDPSKKTKEGKITEEQQVEKGSLGINTEDALDYEDHGKGVVGINSPMKSRAVGDSPSKKKDSSEMSTEDVMQVNAEPEENISKVPKIKTPNPPAPKTFAPEVDVDVSKKKTEEPTDELLTETTEESSEQLEGNNSSDNSPNDVPEENSMESSKKKNISPPDGSSMEGTGEPQEEKPKVEEEKPKGKSIDEQADDFVNQFLTGNTLPVGKKESEKGTKKEEQASKETPDPKVIQTKEKEGQKQLEQLKSEPPAVEEKAKSEEVPEKGAKKEEPVANKEGEKDGAEVNTELTIKPDEGEKGKEKVDFNKYNWKEYDENEVYDDEDDDENEVVNDSENQDKSQPEQTTKVEQEEPQLNIEEQDEPTQFKELLKMASDKFAPTVLNAHMLAEQELTGDELSPEEIKTTSDGIKTSFDEEALEHHAKLEAGYTDGINKSEGSKEGTLIPLGNEEVAQISKGEIVEEETVNKKEEEGPKQKKEETPEAESEEVNFKSHDFKGFDFADEQEKEKDKKAAYNDNKAAQNQALDARKQALEARHQEESKKRSEKRAAIEEKKTQRALEIEKRRNASAEKIKALQEQRKRAKAEREEAIINNEKFALEQRQKIMDEANTKVEQAKQQQQDIQDNLPSIIEKNKENASNEFRVDSSLSEEEQKAQIQAFVEKKKTESEFLIEKQKAASEFMLLKKETGSEVEAHVKTNKNNGEAGRERGLMIGRSVGYGQILIPIKNEEGVIIQYQKDKFQDYVSKNPVEEKGKKGGKEDNAKTLDEEIAEGKKLFIADAHASAKHYEKYGVDDVNKKPAEEPETLAKPNFWSGYINGYNTGYAEGEKKRKAEHLAEQKNKEKAKLSSPSYILGAEIGKFAAMLAIQGKTDFELTTVSEKSYKTTLADVRANLAKGLDPAGEAVEDATLYNTGFMVSYNATYMQAQKAKSRGPSHAEKLADPIFRKGYEQGNQLGRNEKLTPEDKTKLEAQKALHFSAKARTDAATDKEYAKERSGFLYGYNSAFYQLKAEREAKVKAFKEKREKDPIYTLGKAAGTMKGILASVFGEADLGSVVYDDKKIKGRGIDFEIPDKIRDIISNDGLCEDDALWVDPTAETDTKEKEKLEIRLREQKYFFEYGYRQSYVTGYQKGQKEKATFDQNKKMLNPGYKRAMKIVYTTEEGAYGEGDSKKDGVTLNLNLGGLVAYAEFKVQTLEDGDPLKADLRDEISKAKGIAKNEDAAFYQGYKDSYSYFASRLVNPKDKIYQAIANKKAAEAYGGKNPEERLYYKYGEKLANKKLETEKNFKKQKSVGIDVTEAKEKNEAFFLDTKLKILLTITNETINKSNPLLPNITAGSLKDLNGAIEGGLDKDKDTLVKVKRVVALFNNGYNAVIANALKSASSSDKGNDKSEVKKKKDYLFKVANEYKETNTKVPVHNLEIDFTEREIALALKNDEKRAKKLFEQGAAEGFTWAYNAYTEIVDKVDEETSRKTVAPSRKIYTKDEFKKRIRDKGGKLKTENTKKETGDKTKIEGKDNIEKTINGFLYFYAKGYNFVDDNITNAEFGVGRGILHGKSFALGFEGVDGEKIDSTDAYKDGKASAKSVKSYSDFNAAMDASNPDLKEEGEDDVDKGPVEDSYDVAIDESQRPWNLIVKIDEGQELSDAERSQLKGEKFNVIKNGKTEAEILDITADNAIDLWKNKEKYLEWIFNYKSFTLQKDFLEQAKQLQSSEDTDEQVLAKANEMLKPSLESFKKGYHASLDSIKKSVLEAKNGKLFFAQGYLDGFVRIRGNNNIPKEIQLLENKVDEVDDGQEHEIVIDKTHKEYLRGQDLGASLGMKLATGLLKEGQIGSAVKKDKGKDNGNAYVKGQEDGRKLGEADAKEPDHATRIPEPVDYAAEKKLRDREEELDDLNKKKEVDQDEDHAKQVETKTAEVEKLKSIELTPEFIDGFNTGYWNKRDAKGGEIEGLKSVIDDSAKIKASEYYIVIESEDEIVDQEKRVIKNTTIFENNFINAREAAQQNEDPENLLDEVLTVDEEEVSVEDATEEQIQAMKDRKRAATIKKARKGLSNASETLAKHYGYFKAADDMNVADKLEMLIANSTDVNANPKLKKYKKVLSNFENEGGGYTTKSEIFDKVKLIQEGGDGYKDIIDDSIKKLLEELPSGGNDDGMGMGGASEENVVLEGFGGSSGAEMNTVELSDEEKRNERHTRELQFSYYFLVSEEEKEVLREEFKKAFEVNYNAYYSEGTLEYMETFTFEETNLAFPGKEEKGEVKEDIKSVSDAIKQVLEDAEGPKVSDAKLENLSIIQELKTQEQLLVDVHQKIEADRELIFDEELKIIKEQDLIAKKEDILGNREEIEAIIAELTPKLEDGSIIPKEKTKLHKAERDLAKLENIDERIKKIETNIEIIRGGIEMKTDELRGFFIDNLKLDVPKHDNEKILDYIDKFEHKLILKAPFSYSSDSISISGKGDFIIHENAEDVRINAAIKIKDGDYEFKASGFEYIEDRDYISLFSGKAVIPRLEADESATEKEKQEYSFEDIGLEISRGVRGQLKEQAGKLVGGPIIESTGMRDMGGDKSILDKDADQNLTPIDEL